MIRQIGIMYLYFCSIVAKPFSFHYTVRNKANTLQKGWQRSSVATYFGVSLHLLSSLKQLEANLKTFLPVITVAAFLRINTIEQYHIAFKAVRHVKRLH